MSYGNTESRYINQAVYDLTYEALLMERESGIRVRGAGNKMLKVTMPEPWARIELTAEFQGNFARLFRVTGVKLEVGPADTPNQIRVTTKSLVVRDEYTEFFVAALEHFDEHNHDECLVRFGGPLEVVSDGIHVPGQ